MLKLDASNALVGFKKERTNWVVWRVELSSIYDGELKRLWAEVRTWHMFINK